MKNLGVNQMQTEIDDFLKMINLIWIVPKAIGELLAKGHLHCVHSASIYFQF